MKREVNKVSVVGLGYIGLPTSAILASRGVEVIGVDINKHAVATINEGKIHIVEPGLDVLVHGAVSAKKLRATLTPEPAEVFVVAVPTPFKENYEPDLSCVEAAARSIAPVLEKGNLVILESTSPVGATEKLCQWVAELRPDLQMPKMNGDAGDIFVAYCPERVLPGRVIHELTENDRVIGGVSKECAERASSFYRIFVEGDCLVTDSRTAEMVKLTENAFRDVNIAFANELSIICEKLGINVWELIELANRHPRVSILKPGPGVGGHCISIDPWFIVHQSPEEARLMRIAREVNDYKPRFVLEQIRQKAGTVENPVVACLGLAFKPDIDDLRESPSMEIVEELAKSEFASKILVVEPYIEELPSELKEKASIELVEIDDALAQANVVVMLTDHKPFKKITLEQLEGKQLIDTRGTFRETSHN